jgi:SAM-dependent methyltransferase
MTIAEFYDEFYERALNSRAHALFCKRVYGVNLCQHGMADDRQLRILIDELHLDSTGNVLDIGCGPGLITDYLQQQAHCRFTGIDISPKAIERALGLPNPDLRFIVGDVVTYDFREELFDAVLLIDTHYFIDDFPSLIPRLMDRLTPDGKLAVFSDEGKGVEGVDESKTQPHETIIGQYLIANGMAFKGICLHEENAAHWRKKRDVLLALKEEFSIENNQFLFENRMKECDEHDRDLDGRFLFIVFKSPKDNDRPAPAKEVPHGRGGPGSSRG